MSHDEKRTTLDILAWVDVRSQCTTHTYTHREKENQVGALKMDREFSVDFEQAETDSIYFYLKTVFHERNRIEYYRSSHKCCVP